MLWRVPGYVELAASAQAGRGYGRRRLRITRGDRPRAASQATRAALRLRRLADRPLLPTQADFDVGMGSGEVGVTAPQGDLLCGVPDLRARDFTGSLPASST